MKNPLIFGLEQVDTKIEWKRPFYLDEDVFNIIVYE